MSRFAMLAATATLLFAAFAPAGQLAGLQDEIHAARERQEQRRRRDRWCDCDDSEDTFAGALISGLLEGLFSLESEPPAPAVEYEFPDSASPPPLQYANFPYSNHYAGYPVSPFDDAYTGRPSAVNMQLAFEYGEDFDDLEFYAVRLLWERRGIGFDLDWQTINERLPGPNEQLHLLEMNVLGTVVHAPHAQHRLGIGFQALEIEGLGAAAVNGTYRFDAFPIKPFICSGEVDVAVTTDDLWHTHLRLTGGLHWRRAELYGGYDFRHIGDTTLHGPIFGIRFWF